MTLASSVRLRPAVPDDAPLLAPLANAAGGGMPLYLWNRIAGPGGDPWAVGEARIRSEDSGVSYRKIRVAEVEGRFAGMLLAYRQPDVPDPVPDDVPGLFRPLLELEAEAWGTGYVNMVAVVPELRGQGVGAALMAAALVTEGPRGMSLIVSDANTRARHLYERLGYREVARRPMVKDGWAGEGRHWILMIRPPAGRAPAGSRAAGA